MDISPSRPYLFKGLYDWVLDNDDVPYVVVDANHPQVTLPLEYANDGSITLSVHPSSVANFHIDNQYISFDARFSGKSMAVYVPMGAVKALFAKHSGEGIIFGSEPGAAKYQQPASSSKAQNKAQISKSKKSHLRLVE